MRPSLQDESHAVEESTQVNKQMNGCMHIPTHTVSDRVSCESEIRGKGR